MFDFDIINSNTLLGESGFHLHETNEIVLFLLSLQIFFYSIESKYYLIKKIVSSKTIRKYLSIS